MTREEIVAKKTELRANVEELVKGYNEAMQTAKFDEVSKIDAEITKAVNEYTSVAREECFDECAAEENPMLEAIKRLSFTTIGVKDERKGDGNIPVRIVIDKERAIDLLKLHKRIDGGIGHDKNWHYIAEKMNFLLTAQKAIDLGINPKDINDSYEMSNISKQMDMGKTPTSKTNLLKTLQTVITAMLGEDVKATSHDINYLMSVYSRKNRKALTVTCANHRYFRGYLAEICNHIVTGNSYAVDYKKAK